MKKILFAATALYVFTAFSSVLSAGNLQIQDLSPTPDLNIKLGSKSTVIICPERDDYQSIAHSLAEGMKKLTGYSPTILSDSVAPESLTDGPVIVLGNLMDSKIARWLYLQAYDFTDYAWPGVGGYVLRTIRDPFYAGAHVLMVGGSDVDGVRKAADELVAIIKKNGLQLNYLNHVQLGKFSDEIESYTSRFLDDDDSVWFRSGVSGSWDFQISIAQAGIGYLRSGNEDYLKLFKRELRYWFDHDVYNPKDDSPQLIHGFLNPLIITWDLVRDHPFFTDEERMGIDNDFLWVYRSKEGVSQIEEKSKKKAVRGNHGTRAGLDAVFGGRYFLKRFGLKEGKQWMDIAGRYFEPQLHSSKPEEDSGIEWSSSLYNTLIYAMASGKEEYFTSDAFVSAADRALIAHPNAKALLGYLSACAVASGNSGYLSGFDDGDSLTVRSAKMEQHCDDYLRSFCTGEHIRERTDLTGASTAKLDSLWYENINTGYWNKGGLYTVTTPQENCFDKVSIREGWDPDSFYLLFDGVSGGNHAKRDVNCIKQYHEDGISWLTSSYNLRTSATVRSQNGVAVTSDGASSGKLHRYSRLLYSGESGDYVAVSGALEKIGTSDWERHILRKHREWTLVVDRVIATKASESIAERYWHIRGDVTESANGAVSVQKHNGTNSYLHLQSAGHTGNELIEANFYSNPDDPESELIGWSSLIEKIRYNADPDNPIEFATLFQVTGNSDNPEFKLTRTMSGWRIDSEKGKEFVVVHSGDEEGITILSPEGTDIIGEKPHRQEITYARILNEKTIRPAGELPLRPDSNQLSLPFNEMSMDTVSITALAVSRDGRIAGGDSAGNVGIFSKNGIQKVMVQGESPVVSLHFTGKDLIAGDDSGGITRIDPNGNILWRIVIPYEPMAWPYWSEAKSMAREITSADVNGDGSEEILISNSDRRVYALESDGKELWKTSGVRWGIFTAMSTGEYEGQFALMGGTSNPSKHGATILYDSAGKLLTRFYRHDLISWSFCSNLRDMRIADINGDGIREVINGIDTDCRQLVVYKSDGTLLWDADVSGAAEAVAVKPSDKKGEAGTVYCSSQVGYVQAFDGSTGKRHWTCFIGEKCPYITLLNQGNILAASPSGKISIINPKGELTGYYDVGKPITAFLRPGDHRDTSEVLFGTEDGRIIKLNRSKL